MMEYTRDTLSQLYETVRPGEILEFPRTGYTHYGVYVGRYKHKNHSVVHLTKSRGIRMELIEKIMGPSGVVWINNTMDRHWRPKTQLAERIILIYENRHYSNRRYCLLSSNCEHFANYVRYGRHVSHQVKEGGFSIAIGAIAGGVVAHLLDRECSSRVKRRRQRVNVAACFRGAVVGGILGYGLHRTIPTERFLPLREVNTGVAPV